MNPVERTIESFQELVAQVPELVQPIIVMVAAAIPFVEGEGGAVIGVVGGLPPLLAAVAAAVGNFLCVLLVVAATSRARTAVVDRQDSPVSSPVSSPVVVHAGGPRPALRDDAPRQGPPARAQSKGRQRFNRWLVRYGVPGASLLGPLAIPTQFMSAALIGGGTSPRWVLLWQGVAIAVWTTIATVSAWAAITFVGS